ncbi:MAG TPA: uroporphyrinogen decarboxylase [Burkholderiales bacterium]|nr:uroporphyrinogen decarboxylase [Burkholderiales bacterium]
MSKLKNDTVLRALLRRPTPYTPVWIMRQAGRYLPEYNQIRHRAGDFMTLCKNPDLATEVTLQPLTRFKLDAAILFSDILTIPDAMGLGLHFPDNQGPKFAKPLRDEREIKKLRVPDPGSQLRYVMDAVSQINKALDYEVPLIGFSGSPFTLACYMIEGAASTDFIQVKSMLYRRPDLVHQVLAINARAVISYLNAQIESGASVVMIFDTWGGILSSSAYQEFSLHYIEQILSRLMRQHAGTRVPNIVYTKGGGDYLESIAATGCDAIGLDWRTDIGEARKRVAHKVALQGNLDPAVLLASPEVIIKEVDKVLRSFGAGDGHVFNLGHGVMQITPPEHVGVMVDAVHDLSRNYH